MSTVFTHAIVPLSIGLGLGRKAIPYRLLLFGCVFSILPDIDVIGFEYGVSYHSPWGHRGFTHSIVFSVMCALLVSYSVSFRQTNKTVVFLFLALAMISHAVLDALTYGGLGVGIAWPLSDTRFFFDWRPLPASTIGIKWFFNYWGMYVIKKEMMLVWIPMLVAMISLFLVRWIIRGSKLSKR
jgi:inner membrane protein